jgi:photosystem II stability/assembly factor-like uncharacterized protein
MIAGRPQAGSSAPFGLPRRPVLLLLLLLCVPLTAAPLSSEPARLADKSLLLGLARAGARLVAVGDRGHVLLSDDEGLSWRQVLVPARAMLTGVSFGDTAHGWAAGHDGVILATTDAGQTWTRQDDGNDLETVWLDVSFSDARHGLIVGAYGKCQLTVDGGRTWQPAAPPPGEVHLNQISRTGTGVLYVAGEAGTLLTTSDAQREWRRLAVPYDGSLYGTVMLPPGGILVYGLRGHVYVSDDAGQTWFPRPTDVPVLIMTGLRLKSGTVVLAGTGGNFFVSRDGARTFQNWKPSDYNGGVSALLESADGALVVAGELGVARLALPGEPLR